MVNKKIKWNNWNKQAFKKASSTGRLILLDITASWCHWCHVMDSTTYVDEEVIKYIEDNFIAVRVDRDKRPDIDGIYNLGGWPSTVVLSPEGEILTGGTYMPPEELLHMLKEINNLYVRDKGNFRKINSGNKSAMNPRHVKAISRNLDIEIQDYVTRSALRLFDVKYGGFGKKPKFLYPELLSYLISCYFLSKNEEIKKIIIVTLDIMYGSDIYDKIDGGFFRYATERDFTCPHYEKLLDDNARLMSLYLEAYQVFNLPRYFNAAEDIFEYMKNNLYDDKKGLFYGSQSSDEEYYMAKKKQCAKIKKPMIDKTFYADKNSLAIIAIMKFYCITDNEDYLKMAIKAVDTLLNEFINNNGLVKHYLESNDANNLEDQIYMITLLMKMYSLTGNEIYLDKSVTLANKVIEEFYDDEEAGFFDFLPLSEVKDYQHLKSLNTNSEMAKILIELFLITDNKMYYQHCQEVLLHFSCVYQEYGIFASNYAEAVEEFTGNIFRIILTGKLEDDNTRKLFNDLKRLYYPYGIIQFMDIGKEKKDMRTKEIDYHIYPKIYVCGKDKCFPPVDNVEDLKHIFAKVNEREEVK